MSIGRYMIEESTDNGETWDEHKSGRRINSPSLPYRLKEILCSSVGRYFNPKLPHNKIQFEITGPTRLVRVIERKTGKVIYAAIVCGEAERESLAWCKIQPIAKPPDFNEYMKLEEDLKPI